MKSGNFSEKKAEKGNRLTKLSLCMGPISAVFMGYISAALYPASSRVGPPSKRTLLTQEFLIHTQCECTAVGISNYRKALPPKKCILAICPSNKHLGLLPTRLFPCSPTPNNTLPKFWEFSLLSVASLQPSSLPPVSLQTGIASLTLE